MDEKMDQKVDVAPQVVVEKDKIADPAGLGLAAFALTAFLLASHFTGWTQDLNWLGVGFFYGGLALFISGMWEFKRGNTFTATAFSTYGAFWMSLAFMILLYVLKVVDSSSWDLANGLGWMISGFFIFNVYMTVCSLLTNLAVFSVFFLLSLTELCLFIGFFGAGANWIKAGGYFGIFTAAAAFYGSFASVFDACAGRPVIFVGGPLLRL